MRNTLSVVVLCLLRISTGWGQLAPPIELSSPDSGSFVIPTLMQTKAGVFWAAFQGEVIYCERWSDHGLAGRREWRVLITYPEVPTPRGEDYGLVLEYETAGLSEITGYAAPNSIGASLHINRSWRGKRIWDGEWEPYHLVAQRAFMARLVIDDTNFVIRTVPTHTLTCLGCWQSSPMAQVQAVSDPLRDVAVAESYSMMWEGRVRVRNYLSPPSAATVCPSQETPIESLINTPTLCPFDVNTYCIALADTVYLMDIGSLKPRRSFPVQHTGKMEAGIRWIDSSLIVAASDSAGLTLQRYTLKGISLAASSIPLPSAVRSVRLAVRPQDGMIAVVYERKGLRLTLLDSLLQPIGVDSLLSQENAVVKNPNILFDQDTLYMVWQETRSRGSAGKDGANTSLASAASVETVMGQKLLNFTPVTEPASVETDGELTRHHHVTSTVSVTPLPARDVVEMSWTMPSTAHVAIYNEEGQRVWSTTHPISTRRVTIPCGIWQSGVYSVQVQAGEEQMSQRFLVLH